VGRLGEGLSGPYVDIDRTQIIFPKSSQEDCGLREARYNRRLAGHSLFSEYFPVLKYLQGKCELFEQPPSSPTLRYLTRRVRLVKDFIFVDMLRVGQSYYVFKDVDGTIWSDMNDNGRSVIPADLVKALAFDGSECEKYRSCVIPLRGNVVVKPCGEIVVSVPRSEAVRTESLQGMPESPYCIEADMDNVISGAVLRFYLLTSLDAITFHVAGLAPEGISLEEAVQGARLIGQNTQVNIDPELGMWGFANSLFQNGIRSRNLKLAGFKLDIQSAGIITAVVIMFDLTLVFTRKRRSFRTPPSPG
jgi:hypothetical protein